jgi:flavin-dependent dehydrogenase
MGILLARLGVEPDLCRLGHRAYYGNVSRWGEGPPIHDHFLSRGWDHGWHLDRGAFDCWLRAEATMRGAQLINPATLTSILPYGDGWSVRVRGYGHILARMVVDAAGRRAPLASRLGAQRHRIDALVALAVQSESKPSARLTGLSVIEAVRDGWWYAAPLPAGGAIVMLATDHDIAAERGFRNPKRFAQAWRETNELVRLAPVPCQPFSVTIFPAFSSFINRAAGPNWIAVGDALAAFDPITSSGIAGALSDALRAVPVILAGLETGKAEDAARSYSRSADATLRRYLSERQRRYATERRWPESAFWARRAGSGPDGHYRTRTTRQSD